MRRVSNWPMLIPALVMALLAALAVPAVAAEIEVHLTPGAANDPFAGNDDSSKAMGAYVAVIYNRGAMSEVITAARGRNGQPGRIGEFRSSDRSVTVQPDVFEGRKADFKFENVDASTLQIIVVDFPRVGADDVLASVFPTLQAEVVIRDGRTVERQIVKPESGAKGNRFLIGQFEGTRMVWSGKVAPTPENSTLTVRVRDASGQPIPEISVGLSGAANQTLVTDGTGNAHFSGLITGIFHLVAQAEGWKGERRWFATNFYPAMPMVMTIYLERGNPPRYYGREIHSRQVVFVVDMSGSMRGERWAAAKRELVQCIESLPMQANFSVIGFNDRSWPWKTALVPATDENKAAVKSWLDTTQPVGQTDILGAMSEGLKMLADSRPQKAVASASEELFLLSDGAPTAGETNHERIAARIGELNDRSRVRIHTFEIGNEATNLLRKIADQNQNGSYTAVTQ